jgi:hypothetical protein
MMRCNVYNCFPKGLLHLPFLAARLSILLLLLGLTALPISAQTACSYVISGPATGTSVDVGGTSVSLGDDAVTGALPIGFNFSFFGSSYSSFVISSNGFISFDLASVNGCCSGQALPNNTTPNSLVAGFWEDLAPNVAGTIGYGVFGTAPARRLVVSYTGVNHYSTGIPVTFQIKLHESSNVVEVVCIDCTTDGGLHTQGIDNPGGSVAFVPSGRNSVSFSSVNETTTFTPVDATVPGLTCPANISVPCTQPVTFSNASGTDNCAFARVAQIAGLASGATFPAGTNTVTFRGRDHGASGSFFNGAGGTFTYIEGDSPQTIALKACESVYGTGNCVVGACGSFTYYYRSGHATCNCSKAEGQYEFVYANSGYTNVGEDYGGANAPVTYVPFVRVKGPNGCTVPNTWLLSNDRLGGNFTNCSFTVTVGAGVTASNAGPDQTICGTSATLAANTPSVGTGAWSVIAGAGGTVTTPASPTSGFTGVAGTTYTLRWTISQAPCASSTDDVIITLRANPTASGAGPDQSLCGTSATLAGNTPTVGTGAWTIISGAGGNIVAPTSPNSTFTGVVGTTYTLRWTISNAPCTASTDDVLITFVSNPTAANAGPDQSICGTSATLAANTPTSGTGAWTIISGAGGNVTTPSSPTSTFTGISGTSYTLRWTISNAPCTASTDDVIIAITTTPTTSNAGPDQSVCATATLAGNTPTSGTGTWSIIAGAGGNIATPTSPTSTFTGVSGTTYTLRWTISNSPCPASTDDVLVTITNNTTLANAGPDQNICGTSTTLAGNTPTIGTGSWSIISGAGGNITTPSDPNSGFTAALGTTYTLRWTITNPPCAPTTDDVVIAGDNVAPAITCPANSTSPNTTSFCSGVVTYSSPVGTDNCPSPVTTQTSGIASGGTFPIGTTTNVFRVTDASGTSATCSFTVTVTDAEAPAISCPGNQSMTAATGLCTQIATFTTPVGTDNCSGMTTAQISGLASGSAFPVGTTTNTFRVTDAVGNSTTCSFTVVVTDAELPVISCGSNIAVNNTTGLCTGVATFSAPIGTDNCSGSTTTQVNGLPSGAAYPLGTTFNAFLVTDAAGNSANCFFEVVVTDAEAPAITCPSTVTVNATTGLCTGTATYTVPVGTDNCTGSATVQTVGLVSGASYPVGTTTNIFRVTDAAGNSTTCAFDVVVVDNQLPSIGCPSSLTVGNDLNQCNAIVNYTSPSGFDNCTGSTTVQVLGIATGATFPLGLTVNTFQVTDGAGNTATCSFNVTVADNQAPAITCPANVSTNANSGLCDASASYTAPVGTDNCAGVSTNQTAGLASGATYPVGVTTNVFTATDAASNVTTCSFTVTILDTQLPTITCPGNTTVAVSSGLCGSIVNYTTPAGADNCASSVTTQTAGLSSGSTFPGGLTTNTFQVTDASGNSATCSFNVTVIDNIVPTITCPANITVNAATGQCSAVVSYTAPVGIDNCPSATTALITGLASGSTFPVGTTSNQYRVTDAAGNSANCFFSVFVNDVEAPTIACPPNITANAAANACNAIVTYTTPVGLDNCTNATTTQIGGNASGATFPLGSTTNTYQVTDITGATSTCSFTVTVTDNLPPIIVCPGNISVNASPLTCDTVVTWTPPTGIDNCHTR